MQKHVQRSIHILVLLALLFFGATTANAGTATPYLVPLEPGVVIKPVLNVGDSVNPKPDGTPYRMVGIPDGLGAFDNGDGTFTLLMNHELQGTSGIVRAHGSKGSFVSKWVINKEDLRVISGTDLIQQVVTWNAAAGNWNSPAQNVSFTRFCSANLPEISAFYDAASGLGYNGRLFMNGEESGAEGRAFAHAMDGTSYELPWLGKFSWKNSLANPSTGEKTVVAGTDDSGSGQIYIYVGQKTNASNPVEAAGLTNGTLYGLKVTGLTKETDATTLTSGTFTAHHFGSVASTSGADLEALSNANRVTAFNRPEDGNWDPSNPNDFYFVTTASFSGNSRLWKIHFNDPADPSAGGTVTMLLNGTEGQRMMDNLTITNRGQIFIQEDPGNQPYVARIWRYNINNGAFRPVAQHNPELFDPTSTTAGFLTQDEESSGILDVSNILGEGWFLLDVQAHYAFPDPEIVEGGQLIALHYPAGRK